MRLHAATVVNTVHCLMNKVDPGCLAAMATVLTVQPIGGSDPGRSVGKEPPQKRKRLRRLAEDSEEDGTFFRPIARVVPMASNAAFSGEVEMVLPSSWEDPRRLLSMTGELEEWRLGQHRRDNRTRQRMCEQNSRSSDRPGTTRPPTEAPCVGD